MLRTFIDATNVGDSRWEAPLVDEDWHAMCQAMCAGGEGAEWENMHYKYVELHKAVNLEKSRESKRKQRRRGR